MVLEILRLQELRRLRRRLRGLSCQTLAYPIANSDTPPAAKAYYLRVIRPEVGSGSVRALREMKTKCWALDHLACGR